MKNDFQIQKIRIQQKTQKIRIQQKIVTTYVQTQALCPFYLVPVLSSFIAQEAFMWRGIPWQLPCSEIRQGHITFRKSLSQNQRLWSSGIPKLRSYTVWCLAAVQTDRQTDRQTYAHFAHNRTPFSHHYGNPKSAVVIYVCWFPQLPCWES